jgi:hypothetical protein
MKEANGSVNAESTISRRAVMTSLAAAAVLTGCKSAPEAPPTAAPNAATNKSGTADAKATESSKAALALWLLFTTRFVSISVGPASTKVTLKGKLPQTLQQDLSGLRGSPTATINALVAYLESSDGHSKQFGPVDSAGKAVQLPYAVALQAVQELFENFGTASIPNMDPTLAPYTGSCCPVGVSDILALATSNPTTIDTDYPCLS